MEPHGGQTGRPVLVPGLENIVRVAGGEDLAFALDEDGAVWAWGRGASGVLGDGDTSEHSSAKPVRCGAFPPSGASRPSSTPASPSTPTAGSGGGAPGWCWATTARAGPMGRPCASPFPGRSSRSPAGCDRRDGLRGDRGRCGAADRGDLRPVPDRFQVGHGSSPCGEGNHVAA
ncbi:hypothetical protein ACR6C2_19495 [Streptomyces sp. INA 01156]